MLARQLRNNEQMSRIKAVASTWRQHLLIPIIALLTLYVVVPQIGAFHDSGTAVQHVDKRLAAAALAASMATYVAAAGTYYWLTYRKLAYFPTVLVQVASMFVNRLLPAGIGALGANFAYLRHRRVPAVQASAVVALNNTLGFAGHALLLALVVAAQGGSIPAINDMPAKIGVWWLIPVAALVFIGMVFWFSPWRRRARNTMQEFGRYVLDYRKRPGLLSLALGCSMLLTLANVVSLYCCLHAVHGSGSLALVMLVFSFGVSLGTAVPTPGGLGGFEAGLVAGFVAFGVPAGTALAAALLFRFFSYWLAIIAGALAYALVYQRHGFRPE